MKKMGMLPLAYGNRKEWGVLDGKLISHYLLLQACVRVNAFIFVNKKYKGKADSLP